MQFVEQNPAYEVDRHNHRSSREIHNHYEKWNFVNLFTILTLVFLLSRINPINPINPINLLTLNCRSILILQDLRLSQRCAENCIFLWCCVFLTNKVTDVSKALWYIETSVNISYPHDKIFHKIWIHILMLSSYLLLHFPSLFFLRNASQTF